jgi:hypothetical protein
MSDADPDRGEFLNTAGAEIRRYAPTPKTPVVNVNVLSPKHYTQGHLETIYVIEQVLGKEGFKAFCMGNYIKYKERHAFKNGAEDLAKAEQYLTWAVNGLPEPIDGKVPR